MTEEKGLSTISQNQAMYLAKSIWPEAPEKDIIVAGILCRQYNLNPLMKQVHLVRFKGQHGDRWEVLLGIKATRQIARQAMKKRGLHFSYADGPRVMTEDEQVKILGAADPDKTWAITVLKDSAGNTFPGYGWWPKSSAPYGSDKGNSAVNMAFIRSERNAIDKMAPGELPDFEPGDESYTTGNFAEALELGKAEIIEQAEKDIVELCPEQPPPPPKSISSPNDPRPRGNPQPDRDPAFISTIRHLELALWNDFGLTIRQQLAELGIESWNELTISPKDAYIQVKGAFAE